VTKVLSGLIEIFSYMTNDVSTVDHRTVITVQFMRENPLALDFRGWSNSPLHKVHPLDLENLVHVLAIWKNIIVGSFGVRRITPCTRFIFSILCVTLSVASFIIQFV